MAPWKEKDFEQWFEKNPLLPGNKRVLIIARERSICRVPDIVALDKSGGIVVMEIKNEKSTRSAVGQAMEYLAQFDDIGIEALAAEFANRDPGILAEVFEKELGVRFTGLTCVRRVLLIAPSFDAHSCNVVRFLNQRFSPLNIQFMLLKAQYANGEFRIEYFDPPGLRHSCKMVGSFGQTPWGRLVYVLEGGNPQVFWCIGKRRDDGSIRFATGQAVTKRALRHLSRLLIPLDCTELADMTLKDSSWESKRKPQFTAKVIGSIGDSDRGGKTVFFAQWKHGRLQGFRKRPLIRFLAEWQCKPIDFPSWRDVLKELHDQPPSEEDR